MALTVVEIEDYLSWYFSRKKAATLAQWVVEDMALVGMELNLSNENPPGMWLSHGLPMQAEYILPKTAYDINSANDDMAMAGSFATCGNLLRLAQCVELGRQYIPHLWPGEFGPRLLANEHLDATNEVFWLKFLKGIQAVDRGPKANKTDPDFEWEIKVHDGTRTRTINLEVKRRSGNMNQFFKRGRPNASVSGVAKKFSAVGEDSANIVALTIYFPYGKDVSKQIMEWLDQHPHVHGILIWIEGSPEFRLVRAHFKPEKEWVGAFLATPAIEDFEIIGRPVGTLCKASEAPEFVQRIAREHFDQMEE